MKKEKIIIDISYESILRLFAVSFFLFFLYYIRDLIFIIFISVLLALTMEPAVDKMHRKKGIPRVFGAGILFAVTFIVLGIIIYAVAPTLAREIAQMATVLPAYFEMIDLEYILDNGQSIGLQSSDVQDLLIDASVALRDAASFLITGTLGFLGGIFSVVLIAVISFYLVLEDNGVEKFIKAAVPGNMQARCIHIVKQIETKLGQWFIGQVTLGFIVGILSLIGLYIIGVPYALVLALIAGVFELIPYIGPMLSAIPAVLIAATVSPTTAVLTFILYFLIQEFENYIIVPKVMEKSVGLHPIIIIIAAAIGGQLAGIAGMILAVPVATIISIIFQDVKKDIKNEKNKH